MQALVAEGLGDDIWFAVVAQLQGTSLRLARLVCARWARLVYHSPHVQWVFESVVLENAIEHRPAAQVLKDKGCVHFGVRTICTGLYMRADGSVDGVLRGFMGGKMNFWTSVYRVECTDTRYLDASDPSMIRICVPAIRLDAPHRQQLLVAGSDMRHAVVRGLFQTDFPEHHVVLDLGLEQSPLEVRFWKMT